MGADTKPPLSMERLDAFSRKRLGSLLAENELAATRTHSLFTSTAVGARTRLPGVSSTFFLLLKEIYYIMKIFTICIYV
jgi:hypothetical protein